MWAGTRTGYGKQFAPDVVVPVVLGAVVLGAVVLGAVVVPVVLWLCL